MLCLPEGTLDLRCVFLFNVVSLPRLTFWLI